MNTLIVLVAQYAIGLVALGALVAWWRTPRPDKVPFAVEAVLGLVLALVLVKVSASLHADPRPFVQHPGLRPLFPHPADNGFPSDHTAISAVVAFVVLARQRLWGVVLLALSVLIGAARVAAHVHHWQDIGGGLLVGLVAAGISVLVVGAVVRHVWPGRVVSE